MTKERPRANASALSRRTLLAALPASGALMATTANATEHPLDPIVPIYHEWINARREHAELLELPGNEDWDDPRTSAAERRIYENEYQMLTLQPTSKEGIAALAALAWDYCGPTSIVPEERAKQSLSSEARAIKAIWKACTGLDGYPKT